ncbi:UNVERIFIED_CONTAM: hypothetical protein GTU68_062335 [Idotea baltica]|nr:hypothetical protein [Idotea baltica]
MLHNYTEEVVEVLEEQKITGYIGFDPTAPSLTIGNYIQIMILHFFQKAGHTPIVLMGGATGRIGDPSFKDTERDLKTFEELDKNLAHQQQQFERLLDFTSIDNRARLVNNLDFYQNMNVLDFLRDVGKSLNVSYMLAKDSVKTRLEKGLSFTEFSYQLLQGYDFQLLYSQENCILQMGGSDQWGNITSGTEFIRKNLGAKAFAITTPLLTKSDGSKFGKSAEGNIWLDPKLTSPYKFYQFWINADDNDLSKYLRYFSFRNREEIEKLEKDFEDDLQSLKKVLAEEMTVRIHSQEAFEAVLKVSELLFNRNSDRDFLGTLRLHDWEAVEGTFDENKEVINLLTEATNITPSKGDARRAIKGNAISINKVKVSSFDHEIVRAELFLGNYLLVENGKKNKFVVKVL